MSQIESLKKCTSFIKADKTDYQMLIANQNNELDIDVRKLWIDNALVLTVDWFALLKVSRKTRL